MMVRRFAKNLFNRLTIVVLMIALSGVYATACCWNMAAPSSEPASHCPLAKSDHCGLKKSESGFKINAGVPDCCSLKLNLFFATLEKKTSIVDVEAPPEQVRVVRQLPRFISGRATASNRPHRPPSLSARIHVKNCIFRI